MSRSSRTFGVWAITVLLAVSSQPAYAANRDGYLYAASFYDGLYQDDVQSLSLYDPLTHGPGTRPYLELDVNADTRTRGGDVPQVYNDNYALAGAGIEFVNTKGFRAAAQVGLSAQIGSVVVRPSGGDVRVSTTWFRGWGGPAASKRWYGNFSTGANYLSRYHLAAAYSAIEMGTSVARMRRATIDAFARGEGYFETNVLYYPPAIDGALGLRLRSPRASGFALEFTEKVGVYLRSVPTRASNFGGYHVTLSYGTVL